MKPFTLRDFTQHALNALLADAIDAENRQVRYELRNDCIGGNPDDVEWARLHRKAVNLRAKHTQLSWNFNGKCALEDSTGLDELTRQAGTMEQRVELWAVVVMLIERAACCVESCCIEPAMREAANQLWLSAQTLAMGHGEGPHAQFDKDYQTDFEAWFAAETLAIANRDLPKGGAA